MLVKSLTHSEPQLLSKLFAAVLAELVVLEASNNYQELNVGQNLRTYPGLDSPHIRDRDTHRNLSSHSYSDTCGCLLR